MFVIVVSFFRQKNIYQNASKFAVSSTLVVMLLYYMYSLSNHNLELLKIQEEANKLDLKSQVE